MHLDSVNALDEITENYSLPIIYIITPTANHITQRAHLTRIAQTLALVPNVRWIVVEDTNEPSSKVENILRNSRHPYAHLWIHKEYNESVGHYRGSVQRNLGIAWLRNAFYTGQLSISTIYSKSISMNDGLNSTSPAFYTQMASNFEYMYRKSTNPFNLNNPKYLGNTNVWQDNLGNKNGVVYFADDDNTYDLDIFNQMRDIKKVGVWPVALCGGVYAEKPLVKEGKVTGWLVAYAKERPIATDMAGFAVNLKLLLRNKDVYFIELHESGSLESNFVERLVDIQDLEPLADNCTKVIF
ncbi:unnamed protein product [Gordionus sp. m RMFG-2023]|uniref:galactosylgalactosylxylosylprotein 3-beta-glucuronosyltransferase 3-like n=1 Tax=Gordionus sp. m RMFG-2023 TaxID=3053472 RepID=UPI0030E5B1F3